MAVFNSFTFDNENSLDYGVYITGEAVYNAPERAVEMVSIPGKNGALALDQGRFENIEVTYPAGTFGAEQAEFAGRMRAMRNMLASRYNYVRLTDSYHPDEYRLGLYKSGLEATPVAMSSAGEFDLTFNCKPQRFLTSGEEPVDTSELGGEVTTDRDPYLLRRSGGGNIGHDFDAEIDTLIGGTVAWNQLMPNNLITTITSLKAFSAGTPLISGHKYLVLYDAVPKNGSTESSAFLYLRQNGETLINGALLANNTTKKASIYNATASGIADGNSNSNNGLWVYMSGGLNDTNFSSSYFNFTDLTALFGSAEIADYVYSLEQTTAGAGVEWLKSHGFIDGSYRAYDSGSLQSVKTSEHRTVGFNQWDEEWEVGGINDSTGSTDTSTMQIRSKNYIPVVPNTAYYFHVTGAVKANSNSKKLWAYAYDANKQYIGRITDGSQIQSRIDGCAYTLSSSTHFIRFKAQYPDSVANYRSDICINISDSSKNGQYEPYESHSYPLDSDLELRGKFKLDANNNLYAEGDIYPPSGEVSRTYTIVDLGTLNWVYSSEYSLFVSQAQGKKSGIYNGIIAKYTNGGWWAEWAGKDLVWCGNANNSDIVIRDTTYTDAQTFKAAMSGTYLVYELATPTTETAQPYASVQVVSPLGTEEYIDTRDVPVPVGHETKYGMSQLILSNPTEFPSKPLLEVTGVGTFWLGDTLFTITGTAGQTIYIDCETGEAWKNTGGVITPANGLVTLNRLDFPELDPGDTAVMYGTGITKVVVTPRWWII